jgi:hypothetical protein
MFKKKILEIFTESIECIVGDPIVLPKNRLLTEESVPRTNVSIDSSAITQAGYSRNKKELYLRFSSNPAMLYIYHGISRHLKDKFKFSPSKGQFFHKFIRDKFKTTKILGG